MDFNKLSPELVDFLEGLVASLVKHEVDAICAITRTDKGEILMGSYNVNGQEMCSIGGILISEGTKESLREELMDELESDEEEEE